MKINSIILLFSFISFSFLNAQTFDFLKGNMEVYNGGPKKFYEDLNMILVEKKIDKCSKKQSEMFLATIKINDTNEAEILNEKKSESCAEKTFSIALLEINKLKNWKKIKDFDNKFSIIYYPIDYFENFKNGYTVDKLKVLASFPGGMLEIRNQLVANLKNLKNNRQLKAEINFQIDTDGNMINIKVKSQNSDADFENVVKSAVEEITTKWSPEKFRGLPVRSSFRLPITISN